jgi:hypothetical protein
MVTAIAPTIVMMHHVTDSLHVVKDVRGIEDGRSRPKPIEDRHHVSPAERVKRRGWFVEDEQLGLVDLGLREPKPLNLSTRPNLYGTVSLVGDGNQLQHLVDTCLDPIVRTGVEEPDGKPKGLACGHARVEPRFLGQVADSAADFWTVGNDVESEY